MESGETGGWGQRGDREVGSGGDREVGSERRQGGGVGGETGRWGWRGDREVGLEGRQGGGSEGRKGGGVGGETGRWGQGRQEGGVMRLSLAQIKNNVSGLKHLSL